METQREVSVFRQTWHFFLHLRWHYQVFILSGGYLLGGVLADDINWQMYLIQFANVHLLLFGGATAFNSYWDNDDGPIGGLKNPPKMKKWMWSASLFIQILGLLLAGMAGKAFVGIYLLSMLLFWLYSTPHARWKGTPVKSMIAIGVSTGTNSLLLGYLASGSSELTIPILGASIGVALIILSLYPTSQIYQLDEDIERGDETFAIRYGIVAVIRFFQVAFFGGLLLISMTMIQMHFWLGISFFVIGVAVGIWVGSLLKKLTAERGDYQTVMRIKFTVSLAFVLFLVSVLLVKHTSLGTVLGLEMLLQ